MTSFAVWSFSSVRIAFPTSPTSLKIFFYRSNESTKSDQSLIHSLNSNATSEPKIEANAWSLTDRVKGANPEEDNEYQVVLKFALNVLNFYGVFTNLTFPKSVLQDG